MPGSKLDTPGPELPGTMPGNDTELSEQNSVFIRFGSGGRVSVSTSGGGTSRFSA